jgi:hypothetical protein
MFNGVEPTETLALAALACDVPDDNRNAGVFQVVLELLRLQEQVAGQAGGAPDEPGESAPRAQRIVPGVALVIAAASVVRTPDVPLPREPVPVSARRFPVPR